MNEYHSEGCGLYSIYCLFAVVYAFMKWGFWWGIFNIFLPISPIVDLIKHLCK